MLSSNLMIIGILRERSDGENRVALVPASLAALLKAKLDVVVETTAGESAGYSDQAYLDHGAKLVTREEVLKTADVLLTVRCLGAVTKGASEDIASLRDGQILIGMADPLSAPEPVREAAKKGATVFSLELVPRTTRAQAMDVLSSQANLAGYKAVLLGATELPKILPMMTTAAGTIAPSRAFIIGVGVAGLQAIATAKRLGAVVSAYDVRPEVKQQIESLGAKAVELPLEAGSGEGGYARQMDEAFYAKQRELMAQVLAESDLVVTTAAVPGKKAPILVTQQMVEGMRPGSVIVDMAAERGGNCEVTKPGETVVHQGVTILGPLNLPSTLSTNASALYSKNIISFLLNMVKKDGFKIDLSDQIVAESILTQSGDVVNARVRTLLGLEVAPANA